MSCAAAQISRAACARRFSSLPLQEQISASSVFPYSFSSSFPLLTIIVRVRINADALPVVHGKQFFQLLPVGTMNGEALLVDVFLNIAEVGVDAVYAEVLPEDKAAFIRQEKAKGHTVIMVGDGVNDSPALSEADAGIAISTGAAIAREIADITVSSEDLFALVTLRKLGEALMARIHGSYRFIVGFNLTLIALGVAGVLPPTTSALLHNGSTLGISLRNMTDLLDENKS